MRRSGRTHVKLDVPPQRIDLGQGNARQIAGIVHGADGGGEGADAPDDDGWEVSYSDRSVQTDFVARRPVRPARPPERSEASTVS